MCRTRVCSWTSLWSATSCFFFFNDTATTEIYTLSLHDALPIFVAGNLLTDLGVAWIDPRIRGGKGADRKSTRLNSSHSQISYAVFCLKKKIDHCHASGRVRGPLCRPCNTPLGAVRDEAKRPLAL